MPPSIAFGAISTRRPVPPKAVAGRESKARGFDFFTSQLGGLITRRGNRNVSVDIFHRLRCRPLGRHLGFQEVGVQDIDPRPRRERLHRWHSQANRLRRSTSNRSRRGSKRQRPISGKRYKENGICPRNVIACRRLHRADRRPAGKLASNDRRAEKAQRRVRAATAKEIFVRNLEGGSPIRAGIGLNECGRRADLAVAVEILTKRGLEQFQRQAVP